MILVFLDNELLNWRYRRGTSISGCERPTVDEFNQCTQLDGCNEIDIHKGIWVFRHTCKFSIPDRVLKELILLYMRMPVTMLNKK